MPPFDKVKPGQPLGFPAAVYNEMLDGLGWIRQQRGGRRPGVGREIRDPAMIRVKNNAGADLEAGSILALGVPIISPDDNEDEYKFNAAFTGVEPDPSEDQGRFVVLLETAGDGDTVWAALAGGAVAWLNVLDESHTRADVDASDGADTTLLASAETGGAEIVWAQPGTGEKLAFVRLAAAPAGGAKIGRANGDVDGLSSDEEEETTTPGSGEFTEWEIDDDGELVESDPTQTFTGYNLGKSAIDEGDFCLFVDVAGKDCTAPGGGKSTQRRLMAKLEDDLANEDETATISNVRTLAGDEIDDPPDEAQNLLGWAGASGDVVLITEDTSGDETVTILDFVKWDTIKPVFDVADDGLYLTKTKQEILGKTNAEEEDPETIMEGVDNCPT